MKQTKATVDKADQVVAACRQRIREMDARLEATELLLASRQARAASDDARKNVVVKRVSRNGNDRWLAAQVDCLLQVVDMVEGSRTTRNLLARRKFRAAVWAVVFCRACRVDRPARIVWSDDMHSTSLKMMQQRVERVCEVIKEAVRAKEILPAVVQRLAEAEDRVEMSLKVVKWLESKGAREEAY